MSEAPGMTVRSMTGQGRASRQTSIGKITVEVRTVNHRGFKASLRIADRLSRWESQIDAAARRLIHRGSVNLNVDFAGGDRDAGTKINTTVLAAYLEQCGEALALANSNGLQAHATTIDVAALTALPGVLTAGRVEDTEPDTIWPEVESVVVAALQQLVAMRESEGANMAASLQQDCDAIENHVSQIRQRAPEVAEAYRVRLENKVKRVLAEQDLSVDKVDLLREVQIYADRADVSEEVTRLGSHLQLFRSVLGGKETSGKEPTGRKLDFIIQEMFRETNTIGAKASQSDVSAMVVEIKCAIERMRELVQNLE
ncbi:MAG: YicC/YloC family endoribonuclease [Planctomycetota bacterium]